MNNLNEIPKKPNDVQWTDAQWQAIHASGSDMLVAAAAGSGKTAVLVQRIIEKVTSKTNPVDVDRLLVLTFTKAAAAEMRSRLSAALEKEVRNDPTSKHLKRQLNLVNKAQISTLHSFCIEVLRSNFYKLDLDPGFSIAPEADVEILLEEAIGKVLEKRFAGGSRRFHRFVDTFSGDRNDNEINKLIEKIYKSSLSHPNPSNWLSELVKTYEFCEGDSLEDLKVFPYIKLEVRMAIDFAIRKLRDGLVLCNKPDGSAILAETLTKDISDLEAWATSLEKSWSEALAFKFGKAKAEKEKSDSIERTKKMRDSAKRDVSKIFEKYFEREISAFLKDISEMRPVIEEIAEVVEEVHNAFTEEKRVKNILDFNDLEHLTLKLFSNGDVGEESQTALAYRDKFVEIYFDEYQDSNGVQEAILGYIKKPNEGDGNMFMVGDVKQSIYKFRLADPTLFVDKYKRFTKTPSNNGLVIDLNQNFRSRAEVLDGTNYIFKQIMAEKVGEINYDEAASLYLGATYPAGDCAIKLHLIDRSSDSQIDEDVVEGDEAVAAEIDPKDNRAGYIEALEMARTIKEMMECGTQVFDSKSNSMRDLEYKDIVILHRSRIWYQEIIEAFSRYDIPVYGEIRVGFFDTTEINLMLNILNIVDNPYQDIPLASVLRSPIVDLDTNELAEVRLAHPKGSFYEAFKTYLKTGDVTSVTYKKVNKFSERLKVWTDFSKVETVSNLLWKIYNDTNYLAYTRSLPSGRQKQANLLGFYSRANEFEKASHNGIFRFLRFIERLKGSGRDYGELASIGEQENVVRIMTIHESKGLEFPVVFIGGLAREMNQMDVRSKYILDKEFGVAINYVDTEKRLTRETLVRYAFIQKAKLEAIAEEMRILYVALTRAKERIHLFATCRDLEKEVSKWAHSQLGADVLLPDSVRASAKTYMDWIGPALIRHKDMTGYLKSAFGGDLFTPPTNLDVYDDCSRWEIVIPKLSELVGVDEETEDEDLFLGKEIDINDAELTAKVAEQLTFEYGFEAATKFKAKQSVTEIKKLSVDALVSQADDEQKVVAAEKKFYPMKTPKFLRETQELNAAEKGTVMHMVMQHIDLNAEITEESIRDKLEELVRKEYMTSVERKVVNVNQVANFYITHVGQEVLNAKKVMREVPFSMKLSTSDIYSNWSGMPEEVLVQGVIDCVYWNENDELVVVDYKTDSIIESFDSMKVDLETRYRKQIDLYVTAIETVTKQTVKHKYLYFFDAGEVLEM